MPEVAGTKALLARDAIMAVCGAGLNTLDLLREVADRLAAVVPYDQGAWCSLDPVTLAPNASHLVGEQSAAERAAIHLRFSEYEVFVPDFTKVHMLARAQNPVQSLAGATGGDPALSPRQRDINVPLGIPHELRAVFRTGDTAWGFACIARREDGTDFSAAEIAFMHDIAPHVAHGLRLSMMVAAMADPAADGAPGLVILDDQERVDSLTPEAQRWIAEMAGDGNAKAELPASIYYVARQARAIATAQAGHELQPAQARVRLPDGRWLLLRGTTLLDGAGGGRSAVFLQAASRAELAPLLVAMHELSTREREVTELLLRGFTIDEIAARLFISRHTVRDHSKAIYAKFEVRSRPELMAKLAQDPAATSRLVPN